MVGVQESEFENWEAREILYSVHTARQASFALGLKSSEVALRNALLALAHETDMDSGLTEDERLFTNSIRKEIFRSTRGLVR